MAKGGRRGGLRGCWQRAGRLWKGLSGLAFWSVGVLVLMGAMLVVVTPDLPHQPVLAQGQLPLIIIDAGHGGKDDGAKARGLVEKELTLDLAFRLDALLRKRGFPTMLTRTGDYFVALPTRAAMANAMPEPAIFISLHFNTGRGRNTNGVETFYASKKRGGGGFRERWKLAGFFPSDVRVDSGEHLAADVQLGICAQTGARNRGIQGRSLHVTRETSLPAILVEGGFISDPMEARLLMNPGYLDRIAKGVADGVERWCELQPRKDGELKGPLVDAGVARDRSFVGVPEWRFPFVSRRGERRVVWAQWMPPWRGGALPEAVAASKE